MKRFISILAVAFLAAVSSLQAQEIGTKEKHAVNMMILELIEEYERTASLSDQEEVYSFLDLFKSQESRVFCDLLGTPAYLKSLSAKDYVKTASSNIRDIDITIKDIRKGQMTWTSGVWSIPVTFKKTISYVDKNGVLFSAEEFYGNDDYSITMNIFYDPADKSCRIGTIDGRFVSDKTFPEGRYLVIKRNNALSEKGRALEDRVTVDGKPLEYNSFGQAIVPMSANLTVGDPDVIIDTNYLATSDNYKLVNFNFKPIRGRFKVRAAVAPLMAYSVKSEYNTRSYAFEGGLDFGTTFVAGNAKCGIYIGAGISMSNVTFSRNNPEYKYGDVSVYDRKTGYYIEENLTYHELSESMSLGLRDIAVPVYFETEHRLSDIVLLSWNIGAKAYIPLSLKTGEYTITGKRQLGDYFGDIADLQDINPSSGFLNPATVSPEPFNISVMANIGVDFNISRNRVFATFKAGFEQGVTPVLKTSVCPVHSDSGRIPVIYHNDVEVICHSPLSGLELTRQAVWFELGLKVKM